MKNGFSQKIDETKNLPSLEEVDAYELPEMLVSRLVKNHGYDQEFAQGLAREAKRMLYLNARTCKGVSPSLKVDDAWHEMLMFTKFYQNFAEFIGKFVHHNPAPGPPDGGQQYKRTKEMYEKEFGIEPDEQFWP